MILAKKYKIRIIAALLSMTLISASFFYIIRIRAKSTLETINFGDADCPVVILDAGHGGEDGGAESHTGIHESHINLSIVLKTDAIFGLFGVKTKLTRTEDISLHSEGANTLSAKKKSDLKNRAALINSVENGILISIHQNSFTDSRYGGAQVFYQKDNEESAKFAKITQEILRKTLDPSNDRKAARISDSVYLMKAVKCTAIVVESGFLSNHREANLLSNDEYQKKIASAVAASFFEYYKTLRISNNK